MRKHGIDLWVVAMREYDEDPVFWALAGPTTFAARRRSIYVLFDRGDRIERIALGGGTQGGLFEARRSEVAAQGPHGEGTRELWGDLQWTLLRKVIDERNPRVIGVDISRTAAFADGLSAGELEGMSAALGPALVSRFKRVEGLAVELLAVRGPDEEPTYRQMNELTWQVIQTAFSNAVIEPGRTRTSDVVWWMRQRVNDLGLTTWFHPSVEVQRRGAEKLEDDPVIERGDVLHCDFGITALRLNTDTQHMAYVLRAGESAPPAGLLSALTTSNKLQDIVLGLIAPGRTGNEILKAGLEQMRAAGIDGSIYSHPIGLHGHAAGPLIGLWDYQDGVPGRGDYAVIPNQWFSVELQATSPVAEWGGQKVRSAQEEDIIVDASGKPRWAFRRQTEFWVIK
jgi:Xaa-Pro aminopeptidase